MVIEIGIVAGYVIAWAIRKVRRVSGRLDSEADGVIDASLDRLHEVVAAKLGPYHPVLADLVEEARDAASGDGEIGEVTRQQLELEIAAAAQKDESFRRTVDELVARLRESEAAMGSPLVAGADAKVFTGDVHVRAERGGIGFGQVAGDVRISQGPTDPLGPGRLGH
jgi:hypothetical protein